MDDQYDLELYMVYTFELEVQNGQIDRHHCLLISDECYLLRGKKKNTVFRLCFGYVMGEAIMLSLS